MQNETTTGEVDWWSARAATWAEYMQQLIGSFRPETKSSISNAVDAAARLGSENVVKDEIQNSIPPPCVSSPISSLSCALVALS